MTAAGLESGGIQGAGGAWWGVLSPPRMGGLTLEEYASAIAARELVLDECGVRTQGGSIVGDVDRAWAGLREHALRHRVPFVRGKLEKTNRVPDWDRMIVNDAQTQESWKSIYPSALLRVCGLEPSDDVGRSVSAHFEKQPSLLWNAFTSFAVRRPSVTGELRAHALRNPTPPPPAPVPPSSDPPDVAVFPGERLPNLSDFARLQCAVQSGDFMGALFKEGIDPVSFARISDRWAKRLAGDPMLRAEYAVMLRRHADLASVTTTERLPPADTLVFPGQKLARVSDFARISRAAKRGEFKLALERAGVAPDTFANLCARFNARMQADKVIEAQFKRLLDDPRID